MLIADLISNPKSRYNVVQNFLHDGLCRESEKYGERFPGRVSLFPLVIWIIICFIHQVNDLILRKWRRSIFSVVKDHDINSSTSYYPVLGSLLLQT